MRAVPFCGDRKEAKNIRGPANGSPKTPLRQAGNCTAVNYSLYFLLAQWQRGKTPFETPCTNFPVGDTQGESPCAVKESPRTRSEGVSAVLSPISVRTEIGCPCGRSTSRLRKAKNNNPALAEISFGFYYQHYFTTHLFTCQHICCRLC